MTELNLMNREELIRLAALDAFGLLDEYETELFNRSFHNAPAAVQDEVIALQAAFASDESLLPREVPDPTLRDRVLERVAQAVEDETLRLAPIGSIGRGRAAVIASAEESGVVRTLHRSARFWRAACFVFATSLAVALYALTMTVNWGASIAENALAKLDADFLNAEIGPGLGEFMGNAKATARVLRPVKGAGFDRAHAHAYISDEAGAAYFVAFGLDAGKTYTIQAVDGESITALGTIAPDNPTFATLRLDDLDIAPVLLNATLRILDEAGNVIVTTAA
jgi:hypothetical protein